MRPVALQELKQLGDGKHWSVEQQLSELDSIGPVKGWLKALHRGDDLWLEAEAKESLVKGYSRAVYHFCEPSCNQRVFKALRGPVASKEQPTASNV